MNSKPKALDLYRTSKTLSFRVRPEGWTSTPYGGVKMTINYDTIKKMAKEQGIKVNDLIALSSANDPYYVGKPAQLRDAEWFADLWQRFGYGDGIHLRRVHYQAQAQDPGIALPVTLTWTVKDGPLAGRKQSTDVYINNEPCWAYLTKAAKYARYLGLVDAGSFVDRRNPDAIINAHNQDPDGYGYQDPTPRSEIDGGWYTKKSDELWDTDDSDRYGLPQLPELDTLPYELPDTPWLKARGYIGTPQGYLVEIWAEKSTMDDVLNPLCRQYGVNYIRGLGEMSISSVIDFLNRVKDAGRPARILYVSDYDPAGHQMPVSVSRKIEFYLEALRDEGHNIALQPIVLTPEQIDTYQLPPAPVKDSDKRKAGWDAIHGASAAVELDSLEALHPGELRKAVKAEILNYYDPRYDGTLRNAQYDYQHLLDDDQSEVIASYQDDIDALSADYDTLNEAWQTTRDRFNELVSDFPADIEAHRRELENITGRAADLHQEIRDDLETADVEAPQIPPPNLPQESDSLLYASGRDYFEQLDAYQIYKNGS